MSHLFTFYIQKEISTQSNLQEMIAPLYFDLFVKAIIIGYASQGKTNIIRQETQNNFTNQYIPTTDLDIISKTYYLPEGRAMNMEIHDTPAGPFQKKKEKFYPTLKDYDGVFFVYAVNDRKGFQQISNILQAAQQEGGESNTNQVKFLLANKSDLMKGQWEVSVIEGMQFAKENGMYFSLVSAKTGENIGQTFQMAAQIIADKVL